MARRNTSGWVKLHLKVLNSDIGRNFMLLGIWMTLIRWANWRESKVTWMGSPRTLKRGELLTSFRELAEYGEVDYRTVSKWINYLVLRGSITVEKSSRGSKKGMIIFLPNYDRYQSLDAAWSVDSVDDHAGDHVDEAPVTMQVTMPTYEDLKNKRTKEVYAFSGLFETLAKEYRTLFPGTTTGPQALARFKAQIKTEAEAANLKKSLGHYRSYLDSEDWRKPKTTFANYLGTKSSGFFWTEYIEKLTLLDPGAPGGKLRPMDEILAEQAAKKAAEEAS